MAVTNGAKGATAERTVAELLRSRGYVVIRAAGSHGPMDLVALRAGTSPILVQVKSGAEKSMWAGFGPAARNELREAAKQAGGVALLIRCRPRKPPIFVWANVWPD